MAEPPFALDSPSLGARFQKVYAGLPLEERKQVVLVLGDEEINWEFAKREIGADSGLGRKIGEKLIRLKII
mgnify:CR=1 FL=1